MSKPLIGEPIRRVEDVQLLTGQAQFTDDVVLPGMLHAAFKRSPHAHATITKIDTSTAKALPGVVAIYTWQDLGDFWQPSPLLVPPPPIAESVFNQRTAGQLAREKVRYVGEPVVMVVAENRYLAEDALDAIGVEYAPLAPVVDLRAALGAGAGLVHADVGSNVAAHVVQEKGSYASIRAQADLIVTREFAYDRGTAAPLEARAIVAQYDHRTHQLTVWDSTQAPIPVRNGLAQMLGLSERQVRVIARFVGGGFGPKLMLFFPEETLVPWAALRLGRPVKWIEDRLENFTHMPHERGQLHTAEMALSSDGRILGIKDVFLQDSGAYNPYGLTVPLNTQCTLLGPYVVPHYSSEFTSIFTNKTTVCPYRGAGRQPGVFVVERLLDLAARQLGIDPIEIRRRNLIPPDQFPWCNEIMYQDFTQLTYDSGNYAAVLDHARDLIGWDAFQNEAARLRADGKLIGIGLVMYVEGSGIGPYEGARVQIESTGKVTVVTGIGSQGQGHYTIFAQIAAELLGLPIEEIYVSTGDSGQFNWGTGTFASRGAVVAGSAVHAAVCKVRDKAIRMAAQALEANEDWIELSAGFACVRHQPERRISLAELAARANPLRGAVHPDTEPGLEATAYFGPAMGATSSGAHAMIVEVDPETFNLTIQRYVVVHDCGRILNPLIVEGQIHGGVAQGIGNAFFEQLLYDEQGNLLNPSFMDYLLPLATDIPPITIGHEETRSPLNPLGTKGAGEAGAIPVGALFAQALEDALRHSGVEILEIPLSANRLWELVSAAQEARRTAD